MFSYENWLLVFPLAFFYYCFLDESVQLLLTAFESRRAPPIFPWQSLCCYSLCLECYLLFYLHRSHFFLRQCHLFSYSHLFLKSLSYPNLPFSCIAFLSPDTIYHIFKSVFCITYYILSNKAFFMFCSTVYPQCLEQDLPYSTFLINIHWINKLLPNTWDLQTWPLTKDILFKLIYPTE